MLPIFGGMGRERTYFRNLEGLRFIGFLFIFFAHAFISADPDIRASAAFSAMEKLGFMGFMGLDFFFVLSAFLITWTLLEERHENGTVSYRNYFFRRSLRIWPLYFLVVGMGFGAVAIKGSLAGEVNDLPSFWYFLSFTLNFYMASHGQEFLFFMAFLWSISVEEQFYIAWGAVMKFFSRHVLKIGLILVLASLFFRWFFMKDGGQIMYNTAGALGNFGIGAIFAWSAFNRNEVFEILQGLRRSTWLLIYVLLALNIMFYHSLYDRTLGALFERTFFALLFGLLVFEQAFAAQPVLPFGRWSVLRYLGKISYGLYMYHGIVITLFSGLGWWFGGDDTVEAALLWRPLLMLAITILLAAISYELFEKKILVLKKKFYGTQIG